jgi:hypothetical protein
MRFGKLELEGELVALEVKKMEPGNDVVVVGLGNKKGIVMSLFGFDRISENLLEKVAGLGFWSGRQMSRYVKLTQNFYCFNRFIASICLVLFQQATSRDTGIPPHNKMPFSLAILFYHLRSCTSLN